MQAFEFWKEITMDKSNFLEQFIALLKDNDIHYCVIDGQGVNAYVEPLVSLDLDVVVATGQIARLRELLTARFKVSEFPHSLNVTSSDSELRVQIQTDERYADFVQRAEVRDVLGLKMPVAGIEDLMRGKVWAALDPRRRASKRQKDLADIARLVEAYPGLRELAPAEILSRLE
jgi:hypothetical protein